MLNYKNRDFWDRFLEKVTFRDFFLSLETFKGVQGLTKCPGCWSTFFLDFKYSEIKETTRVDCTRK